MAEFKTSCPDNIPVGKAHRRLVYSVSCLTVGLLLVGCGNRNIEGTIERPVIRNSREVPTNAPAGSLAWRVSVIASSLRTSSVPLHSGEVLAVEEKMLRQLVLEYNQEITEKSRVFQNRFDAAVKETFRNLGAAPAELRVDAEWRKEKRNLLLDKIYGQPQKPTTAPVRGIVGLSGGSGETVKLEQNGTPFVFTGADAEGRFHLTLSRRGVWCFFVVAATPAEECYWFKRERFLFGKKVEIGAADKVRSYKRDDGDFVEVLFNTKDDFIIRTLKMKYGLLDPYLNGTH